MSNYHRVLPRDLFNEAKLLKGLGFLVLKIHDGVPREIEDLIFHGPLGEEGFDVIQNRMTGVLSVTNVRFTLNGKEVHVYHPYNEQDGLTLQYFSGNERGYVFDREADEPTLSDEFLEFCDTH